MKCKDCGEYVNPLAGYGTHKCHTAPAQTAKFFSIGLPDTCANCGGLAQTSTAFGVKLCGQCMNSAHAKATQPDPAHKHDAAKPRHSLLPPHALSQVIAVLEYGATKYGQSNWKGGMRWSRPWNAAMRHLWSWWCGEENDPESNLSHLAHAAVNCLFLLEYKHNFKGEDDRGA